MIKEHRKVFPLSPLLSNIVLDELDHELSRHGHHFVRYTDDCNIYVRSKRSGERVMASIVRFIEKRLGLKVNRAKSAVSRPEERHFLGFTQKSGQLPEQSIVLLSKRSKERIDVKIRELTPRNYGRSFNDCLRNLNVYLMGWINFFGVCTAECEKMLLNLDAHIRRRLRVVLLRQHKRKRFIARYLIRLGVQPKFVWRVLYTRHKSWWALSHTSCVDRGLNNAYFAKRGRLSLAHLWRGMQPKIANVS